MSEEIHRLTETVTLSQAKAMIKVMAHEQSLLLLSPPGVGKSDVVSQAAEEAGLQVRSLLGTQIAPEDVSGIPRIIGDRSVFCPPRVLLPEKPEPFCLFLDELPACSPDVQKAFYSLLLERRLGEYHLPNGTWVVSAGNRLEDRALIRALSSALINRVFIIQIRVDVNEWLEWAKKKGVRKEILDFINTRRDALMRDVPDNPQPFSTPRAWVSLSRAMDLLQNAGIQDGHILRALAFGRLSPGDAESFCENFCGEKREWFETPLWQNLMRRIGDFDWSVRSRHCLAKANIRHIKDLVVLSESDLFKMKNFGHTCLAEIKSELQNLGLSLEMKLDPELMKQADEMLKTNP